MDRRRNREPGGGNGAAATHRREGTRVADATSGGVRSQDNVLCFIYAAIEDFGQGRMNAKDARTAALLTNAATGARHNADDAKPCEC